VVGYSGPEITVVVVAFNSMPELARCIPAILAQTASTEIIVVDNGSRDGTPCWLRAHYPAIRVIESTSNRGYAGGNNIGIAAATAPSVLVLNPDTILHPGALAAMLHAAVERPRSFINPKLLQDDDTINACGNQMHFTGITTCIGLGDDPARHSGVRPVFALSGAAILAAKADWLALGGFDPQYFMYLEDTDLSLRARLRGYRLLCVADAVVSHRYALKMTPRKFHQLERNRLLLLLKIYELRTLRRALPALLLTEAVTWIYALLHGPAYASARWQGYAWLWRHRGSWRQARRAVQRSRVLPDRYLLAGALTDLPFQQAVGSRALATLLSRATAPLYRTTRRMAGIRAPA
jgi:GT2 family glycosyltransferase